MAQQYKYGTTRKYWRVFLLSLLTLGIYYLFYQWWIFRDLDEHFRKAYEIEPEAYPTINNPTTMFAFLFLLPFYSYYVKYFLLHEHISTTNINKTKNCIAGYLAVIIFIILNLTTLFIVPIIVEYKWQQTFNEHILEHEKQNKMNNEG
ncbi:MAG: hypothetical protein JXA54_12215 [Candidatus Heimdallarchaeota archaeon]|nr:hypothetical protein [Candidatus Heimdallarchaeota archaeon]